MTGANKLEDSSLLHGDYLGKPQEVSQVDVRTTNLRWIVLSLACFINFGNYFCFDNPQALQKYLTTDLNLGDTEFNLLYSVYSFPNIVLPLFGGLLIDRIGVRVAVILFASLLIAGQFVVYMGALHKSYALMLVGRVIFGLGGESLGVSQSAITVKWFMGKELAFSMGATLCIARVGSSLNSFLSPKIYGWADDSLSAPFLVGLFLVIFSWICGFVLTLLDRRAEKQGVDGKAAVDIITLHDIKSFKFIFYLLLFNCFFLYGAFFGLNNNLNSVMTDRFGFSPDSAGNYIPIVYLSSAAITPFFGMFTDRYGKRVFFMLISSCIFFFDHILIAFLKDTTAEDKTNYGMVGALVGVGLFYSTYAAVFWPCVPLVVKEKVVGTAYGIITALQNLMLTIIPLLIGVVHDNTKQKGAGYFWTEILLAGLVFIGIIITSMMYYEDLKKGGRLNRPGTKRDSTSASLSDGELLEMKLIKELSER